MLSTKAKAAATSVKTSIKNFDQENHISATIKDKVDAVDSKFGISEKTQNAARTVASKIDEVGSKAREKAPIQAATTTVKEGVDKLSIAIGMHFV